MGALFEKLKAWYLGADKTQRLITIFGGLFLVVIIGLTIVFASKPDLKPVYTGLSQDDSAAIYDELSKSGFSPSIAKNGDVLVKSQDIPRAKMAIARANKIPDSNGGSLALIDSIGISDSSKKEMAKLKAATERDLEESISTIDGVGSVKVHLSPGKDSAFGDEKVKPTASVHISESAPGELSVETGKAIARLVTGAVTGMDATGVSVITDTGRLVWDGESQNSPLSTASAKMEAESREANRRERELQQELDSVFGAGNTRVMVDVQLNMDSITQSKAETITGEDPYIEETAKEEMVSASEGSPGPSGFESNNPADGTPVAGGSSDNNSYSQEVKTKSYPTSQIKTNTVKAQGDLVSMNVSVLANSTAIEDMAALESHIAQYVAPWKGDPQFTYGVTPVEFTEAAGADQAAKSAMNSQLMRQIMAILPIVALVVVALILIKALGKNLKLPTQTLVLSNGQTYSLPQNIDPELVSLIKQSEEARRKQEASEGMRAIESAIRDSINPEDAIHSSDGEEMSDAERRAMMKAMGIDEDDESVDVAAIRKKIDVPLEQIKKMSVKNPEAVAMLLKSWVLEEE